MYDVFWAVVQTFVVAYLAVVHAGMSLVRLMWACCYLLTMLIGIPDWLDQFCRSVSHHMDRAELFLVGGELF